MNLVKLIPSIPWRIRCALGGRFEIPLFRLPQGGFAYYPVKSQIGYALFRGTFETKELGFVSRTLSPGDVFIDIGANAGLFTIVAARRVGSGGEVWAYEPAEFERTLLRLNLAHNGLENVRVRDAGVSDKAGLFDLVLSEDGAMNSLARTAHAKQKPVGMVKIDTTTLREILNEADVQRLRLIKVDTEGAERQILLPALERLRELPNVQVLFESQDANNVGYGYTAKEFLGELLKAGAGVSQLREDGGLAPITKEDRALGGSIYNFVFSFGERQTG